MRKDTGFTKSSPDSRIRSGIALMLLLLMMPAVLADTEKIVGVVVNVNTTGTGLTDVLVEGGNVWQFNCMTNFSTSQNITKIINIVDNATSQCDVKIGEVNAYCKDFLTAFNKSYENDFFYVQCLSNQSYLNQKVLDLTASSNMSSNYIQCDADLKAERSLKTTCNSELKTAKDDLTNQKTYIVIALVVGAVGCFLIMRIKKPKSPPEDMGYV